MSEMFMLMKWPLVACLLLPGILVYLGLHIVRREVIFVDLALAQVAALGTCLALLLGHESGDWQTYLWSFGFTLVGAAVFAMTRTQGRHRVPQEALVGTIYVVAAALGILLLSRNAKGNEELRHTLIGDVLLVSPDQVLTTSLIYLIIGAVHFAFRKQFLLISFEPERAVSEGLAIRWWDFLFYALFGLVVTSFVQIGGVLMVFSYLVIPAVCASLLAQKLRSLIIIGWTAATLSSVIGLTIAYQFDFPTGATIVCSLGSLLVLTLVGSCFKKPLIVSSLR